MDPAVTPPPQTANCPVVNAAPTLCPLQMGSLSPTSQGLKVLLTGAISPLSSLFSPQHQTQRLLHSSYSAKICGWIFPWLECIPPNPSIRNLSPSAILLRCGQVTRTLISWEDCHCQGPYCKNKFVIKADVTPFSHPWLLSPLHCPPGGDTERRLLPDDLGLCLCCLGHPGCVALGVAQGATLSLGALCWGWGKGRGSC